MKDFSRAFRCSVDSRWCWTARLWMHSRIWRRARALDMSLVEGL
jgi:hypothetical protein